MSLNSDHLDDQDFHDVTGTEPWQDAIGGTMQIPSDRTKEVLAIMFERYGIDLVAKQLMAIMNANDRDVQRVIQAAGEIKFSTVALVANVPSKVCAYNFNRSRLILTGTGANVAMGTDNNISFLGVAQAGFGSTIIGYTSSYFTREVRTYRDIWLIADANTTVGVQEEFMAAGGM